MLEGGAVMIIEILSGMITGLAFGFVVDSVLPAFLPGKAGL